MGLMGRFGSGKEVLGSDGVCYAKESRAGHESA